MDLRLANINDLGKLKVMYGNIIDNMNRNNIAIWDEIYPCEFFKEDIENKRLYLLVEEHEDVVAAFALCESNAGEGYVKWGNANEKALYLDRFGVNVDYSRRGIGSIMLKHAITITKQKNAKYLRLFVVDINEPAINLYLKNGFKQVDGIYEEKIDDDFILREYGFEIESNSSSVKKNEINDKNMENLKAVYPELYEELLKLPEVKENRDQNNKAIEQIVQLGLESKNKSAFSMMINEGVSENRKYCTPLQGLFLIACDRNIDKDNPLIESKFTIASLVEDAWITTKTSKHFSSERWKILRRLLKG